MMSMSFLFLLGGVVFTAFFVIDVTVIVIY